MTKQDIAGQNLATLATYATSTYNDLERRCRSRDGSERATRAAMRTFLITKGLANEVAPGHASKKPGKGYKPQPGTLRYCQNVAKALKT
jgi:hypothetical protein